MKDIRWTNFVYDKGKYHFLFISELKAYGLGHFFKIAISKALDIPEYKIVCITIAPDIFEQYNYENLIIINHIKTKENKRKPHDEFMKDISNSSYLDKLTDKILKNQTKLYVYMFESSEFMTIDKKNNIVVVGPKSDIVKTLSNKISLYEIFSSIVPMADHFVANNYVELIKKANELFQTHDKLFVSLEQSAAGANSIIASNINDIKNRFENKTQDIFLITSYIKHTCDPTSLAVVINENYVYFAGIADQSIEGTIFRGSTCPSKTPPHIQQEIKKQTIQVGLAMAKMGYRGIYGCDFITTNKNKIYFIEVNPRKQGTTMEFCCSLHTMLPVGAPNLPEIEFYAVIKDNKAPNMVNIEALKQNIYWATYNQKLKNRLKTISYLPQQRGEIEMFEAVASSKLTKEYMILEHVGQEFFVNEGSFLARVIATGQNYKDVEAGVDMGKKLIAWTITQDNKKDK